MPQTDFLIIGAGIAGSAVAAELAPFGTTLVLEREPQPGYHSTGRSAAIFSALYGPQLVRALTRTSRGFLQQPPPGFSDIAIMRDRGALFIGAAGAQSVADEMRTDSEFDRCARLISTSEALAQVPILRSEHAAVAVFEPDAKDIDVNALHAGYLRVLRARGGGILCNRDIHSITRSAGKWQVRTNDELITASVLVDAAGAWADAVAELAGVAALGVTPMRRTALLIDAPKDHAIDGWPAVADLQEPIYFKPDAGKLLLSPADETPSPPCDAQPDDIDVAIAVDRFEQRTTMTVNRVTHRWAGLRSFTRDRLPVAGYDPDAHSFFWLAGQGGYGIQTIAALSRAAAALVRQQDIPPDLRDHGIAASDLSPLRLRAAASEANDHHEFN